VENVQEKHLVYCGGEECPGKYPEDRIFKGERFGGKMSEVEMSVRELSGWGMSRKMSVERPGGKVRILMQDYNSLY